MKDAMVSSISLYADNPEEFATRNYTKEEKKIILAYMKSFDPTCAISMVEDCVNGKWTNEENLGYEDGEYIWCSQDMYHLKNYNAAVTAEFFEKVMNSKR